MCNPKNPKIKIVTAKPNVTFAIQPVNQGPRIPNIEPPQCFDDVFLPNETEYCESGLVMIMNFNFLQKD